MKPSVANTQIQDLELSDLTIDGAGVEGNPNVGAEIGLELNRVITSKFRNVYVKNVKARNADGTQPGIGIRLTTDATVIHKDTAFNIFENCGVVTASQGVVLDGNHNALNPSDATQNLFINLNITYRSKHIDDTGILLKYCDSNVFHRVSISRPQPPLPGQVEDAHAVVIESPQDAQANYFYHLVAEGGVHIKNSTQSLPFEAKNVIFGYAIGVDEAPPTTDSSVPAENLLLWFDSRGNPGGIMKLKANGGTFIARGKVSVNVNSANVTGSSQHGERTYFTKEIEVGEKITMTTSFGIETKTVIAIASDTSLTVDSIFSGSATGVTMQVTPSLLRLADSSGNPKVCVSDAGKVGIGTVNPTDELTVNGNLSTTGPGNFGSLKIGGTQVIDSSRNIANVGTVATSGAVTVGPGGSQNVNAGSYAVGGTQVIDPSRNIVNVGTVATSGAVTVGSGGSQGVNAGSYAIGGTPIIDAAKILHGDVGGVLTRGFSQDARPTLNDNELAFWFKPTEEKAGLLMHRGNSYFYWHGPTAGGTMSLEVTAA